jgi:hypothetical protein
VEAASRGGADVAMRTLCWDTLVSNDSKRKPAAAKTPGDVREATIAPTSRRKPRQSDPGIAPGGRDLVGMINNWARRTTGSREIGPAPGGRR